MAVKFIEHCIVSVIFSTSQSGFGCCQHGWLAIRDCNDMGEETVLRQTSVQLTLRRHECSGREAWKTGNVAPLVLCVHVLACLRSCVDCVRLYCVAVLMCLCVCLSCAYKFHSGFA